MVNFLDRGIWRCLLFKVPKSFKSFSTIITGSTIAQGMSIVFAPIVSRLYSPDDYGIASLFFSIVTVLLPMITLRYSLAIFLPDDDKEAFGLVQLCLVVIFATTFVAYVTVTLLKITYPMPFLEKLGNWIYLLPVALVIYGGLDLLKISCTRWQRYRYYAASEIVQNSLTSVLRIIFGLISGSSIWGLIVSMLLAVQSASVTLFVAIRDKLSCLHKINLGELGHLLKKYREFPTFTLPTSLLLTFSDNMAIILFGNFFSIPVVGLLAMARRIIRIPVAAINNATRTALIPQVVEEANKHERLVPFYLKMTLTIFLIILIPFALLAKYSEIIFSVFLGEKWVTSGKFAALLIPLMYSQLVATPVAIFLLAIRRQKLHFYLQLIFLAITLSATLFAFSYTHEPETTLLAYSLSGCLANCIGMLCTWIVLIKLDRKNAVHGFKNPTKK